MSETWGIWVILYLFFAGIGAGSFRFSILTGRKKGPVFSSYADVASLLAPAALAFGLCMLVIDLKYKTRFWLTLTIFNYHSPMSIGVWLLTFFFVVSILYAFLRFYSRLRLLFPFLGNLRPRSIDLLKGFLGFVGMVLALLVSVYTGVLLAVTHVAMWRNFALPALFAFSAFATGFAGAAALAGICLGGGENAEKPLRLLKRAYRYIMPFYLAAAIAYSLLPPFEGLRSTTEAGHPGGWYGLVWWLGVVGLGVVVPYALVLRPGDLGPKKATLLFTSMLVGGFLLRLVLIYAGQSQTLSLAAG